MVTAEGGIDIPLETTVQFQSSHEFYTHAITVGYIGCYSFANFIHFACQYQLFFIIHVIEISAQI